MGPFFFLVLVSPRKSIPLCSASSNALSAIRHSPLASLFALMSPSFNARLSVSTPIFALREASLMVYICIHSPPFSTYHHDRARRQCQEDEDVEIGAGLFRGGVSRYF